MITSTLLYTEKLSDLGSKTGECSTYTSKGDLLSSFEMTWAILLSSAFRNIQLSVSVISLPKYGHSYFTISTKIKLYRKTNGQNNPSHVRGEEDFSPPTQLGNEATTKLARSHWYKNKSLKLMYSPPSQVDVFTFSPLPVMLCWPLFHGYSINGVDLYCVSDSFVEKLLDFDLVCWFCNQVPEAGRCCILSQPLFSLQISYGFELWSGP